VSLSPAPVGTRAGWRTKKTIFPADTNAAQAIGSKGIVAGGKVLDCSGSRVAAKM
jgi:hypothetical protein